MAKNVLRKRWAALAALLVIASALGAVAYADTVSADGDLFKQNNRLQYGSGGFQEPCANRGTPVSGAATITFNGTVHFDSGSTITVVAAPDADASAVGITSSGSTAVVPTPWDTPLDTFTVPITTTVPAGTPNGSYTVNVDATGPAHRANGDALTFTRHDSFVVTVDCGAGGNVAPAISWNAHPFQSPAGGTRSYTFGITDPDSSSWSFAPGYPSCGGDGTVSNAVIDPVSRNASFDCTFGASPAVSTVRARVTDGGANSNELSQDVNVGVGALASITISPDPATIASGGSQAYTAEGFDSFDASRGDVTGATTFSIAPVTGGASCTGATCTATLAGNYTVTGTDGVFSDTATLVVQNAAPALAWSTNPAAATVGETKSYSFTISDPSSASWSFAAGYPSCGSSGTPSNASISGSTGSFDCTFATVPGSSTVSAKVTDGDLASNELSQPVSIAVGALASITISPDTATIASGDSQVYTAEGFDAFHNSRGDVTGDTDFTIAPNGGSTGASCAGATCTAALAGAYTVTGTDGAFSDTAALTVPISAFDSTATVNANSSANPIALDYAPSTATVQSVTQGTSGGAVAIASGAHGVTFTPALDFVGTDTFTYTVTDGAGHTATATVTVSVQTSGTLADAMVFEDDNLKPTNGFDVMFGKSSLGSSYLSVRNTHPDRLELKVDLVNQTGVDIDAARSNRVVAIFTVPDMPTSCGLAGVDCAAAAGALGDAGLRAREQPRRARAPGRPERRHARQRPLQGGRPMRRLDRVQRDLPGQRRAEVHQAHRLRDPAEAQGEDPAQVPLPQRQQLAGLLEPAAVLQRGLQLRADQAADLRLRDGVRDHLLDLGQPGHGRKRQGRHRRRRLPVRHLRATGGRRLPRADLEQERRRELHGDAGAERAAGRGRLLLRLRPGRHRLLRAGLQGPLAGGLGDAEEEARQERVRRGRLLEPAALAVELGEPRFRGALR